jgi:hypothetical protein
LKTELMDKTGKPLGPQPDGQPSFPYIDPLFQQMHQPRLLGREQPQSWAKQRGGYDPFDPFLGTGAEVRAAPRRRLRRIDRNFFSRARREKFSLIRRMRRNCHLRDCQRLIPLKGAPAVGDGNLLRVGKWQ